jgi:hypothetical protein
MASESGDGGRDAELFSISEPNTMLLQYSVEDDWASKLRNTAKRISEKFKDSIGFIYVTNQLIGAKADNVKKEILAKYRLVVDVRDRNYFIERVNLDRRTAIAAEQLAQDIVDPILRPILLDSQTSQSLSSSEARAAHLYLSLQLQDDSQEKGLTRLSYEALVRSVLFFTSPTKRLSRAQIKDAVRKLVPNQPGEIVDQNTDSALTRLAKKVFRIYTDDTFCITHSESVRLQEFAAKGELEEFAIRKEIKEIVAGVNRANPGKGINVEELSARIRRIIDECLLLRAETYAQAVVTQNLSSFAAEHLKKAIENDLKRHHAVKNAPENDPVILNNLAMEVLASSSDAIKEHLRNLSDAYTLMAFLRETPDIQSAVQKIFSHGEIWLDTSILLPLIGEDLISGSTKTFQQILRVCTAAGLSFFITNGVLEELDTGIENSITCAQSTTLWSGHAPFVLQTYLQSGRPLGEFNGWIATIRGHKRPLDDLKEYLSESFGITVHDLDQELQKVDQNVRFAHEKFWYAHHQYRREKSGKHLDAQVLLRLAKHDLENYLGVIERRSQEKTSALGYSAWLLTFDRAALKVGHLVEADLRIKEQDSPILSIDFLAQYISLGPIRAKFPRSEVQNIPMALEPRLVRYLTPELIEKANEIRNDLTGVPERLIRQKVRDYMDEARRKFGPLAEKGVDIFFDEL